MTTLLVCFGGGLLGAALGGLYAFILCGIMVFSGCLLVLVGGPDFMLFQIGLGPIFGPHVGGFTSGVVAVTYAEGIRKNAPGGEGTGKDILSPLMNTSWDVLLVGGIWAVLAHVILQILVQIPIVKMWDCIALTVVIGCMLSRLFFQKVMPWGEAKSIKEHGYFGTDNGAIQWIPWEHDKYSKLTIFALGVGLLSGGIALAFKDYFGPLVENNQVTAAAAFVVPLIFVWSMAAISLIGLNFATGTIQQFPAWHHIAILSALAALLFGNIIVAGVVGIVAGYLGDVMARMFYNHGTNHVDPPACAITFGTFVLNAIGKVMS